MQVTFEDQEKINKFARHNAKLQDLKDELAAKKVGGFILRKLNVVISFAEKFL